MKKIKIEILCDEFYTADSLRELAVIIENEGVPNTEICGDHYVGEVKEIDVPERAATESEDGNTVAVVVLQFDDDDNFKKAQRIFDSEGESKYWAADWNENTRTIYFTDGGDLQSLSVDLIKELDQYGIMGYTRIIRQPTM